MMTRNLNDIERDRLIRAEIEQSEQTIGDETPLLGGTRPNRTRSTVYSVRFTADEVARIEAVARQRELPPSTLVRSWVLRAMNDTAQPNPDTLLGRIESDAHALRELLTAS
jgi:hypothetical protein